MSYASHLNSVRPAAVHTLLLLAFLFPPLRPAAETAELLSETSFFTPFTVSFQQGVDGYKGTADTWFRGRHDRWNYNYGSDDKLLLHGPAGDGRRSIALLRFDDIFTVDGLRDTMTGSHILKATLTVTAGSVVSRDEGILAAPMLKAWQAGTKKGRTATDGESTAGYRFYREDGHFEPDDYWGNQGEFTEYPVKNVDYGRFEYQAEALNEREFSEGFGRDAVKVNLEVTAIVRSWFDGSRDNHGFLLSSGSRNWQSCQLYSSKWEGNPEWRPRLTVEFVPKPGTLPEEPWHREYGQQMRKLIHYGSLDREQAEYLSRLGAPDHDKLIANLSASVDRSRRIDVIWALSVLGGYETVQELIRLFEDEERLVAEAAGKALLARYRRGKFPAIPAAAGDDAEAISLLGQTLARAPAIELQLAALEALGRLDSQPAHAALTEAVRNAGWTVKKQSLEKLSALGIPVCPTLVSELAQWPMWGYDAGRRSATVIELPSSLELIWTRQLHPPRRAWPFQYEDYYTRSVHSGIGKLSFDLSYEPVVADGRIYLPSMVSDRVTAYCVQTGEELWRYYAGGPVRFAPAYDKGRLYFTADDGYLYCLDAENGTLIWRFKGSYASRLVLGNQRLISIWPARGGVVISDGTAYFASGILPFEGVFVHAVCAENGNRIWTNSTSGTIWDLHQHPGAWSYGGPAPQGHLAVAGDKLIVPGGRTPPAVYDRHTGDFLYFRQASGEVGKGAGGYRVHAHENWFFNHGMLYSLQDGAQYGPVPGSVLTDELFIGLDAAHDRITAHHARVQVEEAEIKDRLAREAIRRQYHVQLRWEEVIDNIDRLHFKAGSRIGVSLKNGKAALFRLDDQGMPARLEIISDVGDRIWTMIPAENKLFVVTEGGAVLCFGKNSAGGPVTHEPQTRRLPVGAEHVNRVDSILSATGAESGYAFVFATPAEVIQELADRTELHLVAVTEDQASADLLRHQLDNAGLYGRRTAVLKQTPGVDILPPYLADLVVLGGDHHSPARVELAFRALRPYGGTIYADNDPAGFAAAFQALELESGVLESGADFAVAVRQGPLPGAGQWTHQHAGPANRNYSDENLVKPPLGTLWFGGPANLNVLPRHHSGPVPQVSEGRLFILGVDTISARCVYTGRKLWIRELPGIGHMFTNLELEARFEAGHEVYMTNHPGANVIGSPYVSTDAGVYIIHEDKLLRLSPATGEILTRIPIPRLEDRPAGRFREIERREWGHLLVWEDIVVAAVGPQFFKDGGSGDQETWWNATSSSTLLALDRYSGELLWAREADRVGYRHNAIAAGNGRVYAIDGLTEGVLALMARRGLEPPPEQQSMLVALDIYTGEPIWSREENIFGTWLGYYEDLDLLLEGGRFGGKRWLPDEPRRNLVARRGESGQFIWEHDLGYRGPLGLHPDMIIPGGGGQRAFDPLTGRVITREHPLTGDPYDWRYQRYYGCGTMNAGRHLIAFRSGAAGYTDILNFGGTANLGGFKPGCTNNLVAADGVLNAPDYTRTCTCSYQLQTSFGFIHSPETELWTLNQLPEPRGPIEAVGINLAAPGNRREKGVLWLEYPKIYPGGPDLPLELTGRSLTPFRHHASWIKNPDTGYNWVTAYGYQAVETISLALMPGKLATPRLYDVTLFFAEPEAVSEGDRVFDVYLQGEKKIAAFDVARQAGGQRRSVRLNFADVPVRDNLELVFSWADGSLPAIVSGIKVTSADYEYLAPDERRSAAEITAINVNRLEQVELILENRLTGRDIEIKSKLMINDRKAGQRQVTVRPGEQQPVRFELPDSLDDESEISAVITMEKPEALLPGDAEMSFAPVTRTVLFSIGNYRIIQPVDEAVTIDGDLSFWQDRPDIFLGRESDVHPSGSRSRWQGKEDLSARIYTGWDDEYFYLAAAVRDDKHFNRKEGSAIWDGDSLQFAVNPVSGEIAPVNLGLALASGEARAYQWEGPDPELLTDSEYAVIRDEERNKTYYEIKIPFARLGIERAKGQIIGFNANLFDDDSGDGYEYWLQITSGIAGGWYPEEFIQFLLWE